MTDMGPSMRKLTNVFIAREAVPPGAGLEDVLKFFNDRATQNRAIDVAFKNRDALIEIMRRLFPTYNDEELADCALDKIYEKKRSKKP